MDHSIVSARVAMPSDLVVGKERWAIPTRLVKNRQTKQLLQGAGLELQTRLKNLTWQTHWANPQRMLKEFKDKIRQSLRDHTGGRPLFTWQAH